VPYLTANRTYPKKEIILSRKLFTDSRKNVKIFFTGKKFVTSSIPNYPKQIKGDLKQIKDRIRE